MEERIAQIIADQCPDLEDIESAEDLDDVLDSMDVISIISTLELEHDIEIDPEDIVPENFSSVAAIAAMLGNYLDE